MCGSVGQARDDPAVWEGMGNVPGSDLSNSAWRKIALTELVVQGWDIATATGQGFDRQSTRFTPASSMWLNSSQFPRYRTYGVPRQRLRPTPHSSIASWRLLAGVKCILSLRSVGRARTRRLSAAARDARDSAMQQLGRC